MKNSIILIVLTCLCLSSYAQTPEELLNSLSAESTPKHLPVTGTFKTTRIILSQSNETVEKYGLDFRVAHRFDNVMGSGGGYSSFYGFDVSRDIRIAFEYGITDRLTIGIGRNKIGKTVDGLIKYKLLQQTTDNSMPVSVTLFSSLGAITENTNAEIIAKNSRRLSYAYQAIITRKFSRNLSLALLPSIVHRNYIPTSTQFPPSQDDNNLFALGFAGRMKVSSRFALVADYYYVNSAVRQNNSAYNAPLGLGFEIETGGHVFSLNFTNASGIIENTFIPGNSSDWLKGEFKFGFNISRVFNVYKKDKENRSSIR